MREAGLGSILGGRDRMQTSCIEICVKIRWGNQNQTKVQPSVICRTLGLAPPYRPSQVFGKCDRRHPGDRTARSENAWQIRTDRHNTPSLAPCGIPQRWELSRLPEGPSLKLRVVKYPTTRHQHSCRLSSLLGSE